MNNRIICYKDELNDDFSKAKITPRIIDETYIYEHKNLWWEFASFMLQNFLTMPIKILYGKIKLRLKYYGKEKLKKYKKEGYFVYVNHTQEFADVFIPSLAIYPKRNFFIVNPENVSMKILGNSVQLMGAIPIPNNISGMKNFIHSIHKKIEKNYSITIYPEAHIWPFYTKIRPFKAVSFKYPIKLNKPAFCMTNTYQKYGKNKFRVITYIDGPFFTDETKTIKERQLELRNMIYNKMVERSKNSNYEHIKYIKEE